MKLIESAIFIESAKTVKLPGVKVVPRMCSQIQKRRAVQNMAKISMNVGDTKQVLT